MNQAYVSTFGALIQMFDRWHFCILKGPEKTQIDTLNFVNPGRLETMKENFFKGLETLEEEKWPEELRKEVHEKIFEKAESYRPWFESNKVNLVVGFTTDTLTAVPNEPDRIPAIVEAIQELMEEGHSNAYLRFSA